MKLSSRAALMRAIRLPGLTIRVVNHWQPNLCGTERTPKVLRNNGRKGIQTNGYYFDGPGRDGQIVELWANIPPASELRFNPDGSVTFYPDTERSWTLFFEMPEATGGYAPRTPTLHPSRTLAGWKESEFA